MRKRRSDVEDDEERPGIFEEPAPPEPPGRGPYFDRTRYPEADLEPEHVVPGKDPLRRDRIANLPDLPLEHVVDPTVDRAFRRGGHGSAVVGYVVASGVSSALALALRAGVPWITEPRAGVVWALAFVWVFIWAKREKATTTLASALSLVVPLLFVVSHVIRLADRGGHEGLLAVGGAAILVVVFVDLFSSHWVRVLLATGALPVALRKSWTRRWRLRWVTLWPWPRGARAGTARAAWACLTYPLGFALLLWIAAGVHRPDALFIVPLVSLLGGLLLGVRAGVGPTPLRLAASLGRAASSWFFYGVRGMWGPGVMQSPAGAVAYRVSLLMIVLVVLSGTLLPPVETISASVNLKGLGPIATTTKAAALLGYVGLFPLLVLTGVALAVSMPVFSAFEVLTDGSSDERAAREFDFASDALRSSKNEVIRRQVFFGFHATSHYAVAVPSVVCEGHELIVGGDSGGKTSLAMLPRILQRLGRTGAERGAILVVDTKPDLSLFFSVKAATERAGRRFRFFTNEFGDSTHAFNVIAELHAGGVGLTRAGGAIQDGLNWEHGGHDSRSQFLTVSRGLIRMMLRYAPEARSLREVCDAWKRRRPTLRPEERRLEEKAYEVLLNFETLAEKAELNVTDGRAFEERIDMTRAVREDEVLFFALSPKAEGEAISRFVGGLAVDLFYQAILRHNGARDAQGKRVNAFKRGLAVVEEFAVVAGAGRNFENFMEAARDRGLSLMLSCQSKRKLAADLRVAVETCTAVQQYFTARTPAELRELAAVGGTTMNAVFDLEGGVKLERGERLSQNMLKAMSAEENLSVLVVNKSADYAQLDGCPILLRAVHCQSKAEYDAARGEAWPVSDGLIVVGSDAAASGTNVVELPVAASASPAAAAPPAAKGASSGPKRGTPLAALFDRIVVTADGYGIPPAEERGETA